MIRFVGAACDLPSANESTCRLRPHKIRCHSLHLSRLEPVAVLLAGGSYTHSDGYLGGVYFGALLEGGLGANLDRDFLAFERLDGDLIALQLLYRPEDGLGYRAVVTPDWQ